MTLDELKEVMETGEEFETEYSKPLNHVYRFWGYSLLVNKVGYPKETWVRSGISVNDLLEYNIIRKPWKPKVGGEYYMWSFQWDREPIEVISQEFNLYTSDLSFIAFGNCFKTKEECESHTEIRDKLIEMRKEYV